MKTRMNILTLACALTCFSCIGTAHTIQPSKNYQTEKRSLGDIREVSTLSSIDVVYHQTSGSPYAEIYASDNVMPYVVLKESKGELRGLLSGRYQHPGREPLPGRCICALCQSFYHDGFR